MSYRVSLSSVRVPDEAYPMIEKALREGKVGQTEYIEQFEEAISSYVGAKYCIAVSNGTMADAVAVGAFQEIYGCDAIVVPALTFIAQPNSVRYNNIRVIFTDVGEDWLLDLSRLYSLENVFFADIMGRLDSSWRRHAPFAIEDACEAFGSKKDGRFAGTFGLIGTYSFFPSHTISTGEGGAIVTDDPDIAVLCRSLRAHGSKGSHPLEKFQFPHFGFNAKMTTLQAILGICLMQHINEYIYERRLVFHALQVSLGGFREREGEELVPHGFPIEYACEADRDAAMLALIKAGIECRKFFSCIPRDERIYAEHETVSSQSYPVADHIAHTHLYVPCHQNVTPNDVIFIADTIRETKGRVHESNL